jgi:NAD(P)-dependent dehydrogenase (short-subunit alcohol dehydrogenase family)
MGQRLEGKVAIVTGAGRGIGEAMARALADNGARVVVADISGDEAGVAESIGDAAVACRVDVASSDSVAQMIATTVDRYGTVDVLCNNAGIDGEIAPAVDCTPENFDRVISINLRGVFLGTHHVLPVMLAGGGGSIINTASVAAVNAVPGAVAYCAAKAGVLGLTRATAADHSRAGVRANAILPGVIETPMYTELIKHSHELHEFVTGEAARTAIGRTGRAKEVADTVVFLASDEASFITGVALPIDGGYTA